MTDTREQNSNQMALALSGALLVHFALVFLFKLPTYHFHGIVKNPSEQLEVKLVSYVEDKVIDIHDRIIRAPLQHKRLIAPHNDNSEAQEHTIKNTGAPREPKTIVFNYSDVEKWIENDTAQISERKNKVTFRSERSPPRSRTIGYGTIGDINREQIILKGGGVITSYESGLYSVDVKTKLFGKDICYKFDHSRNSFGVATPYRCPQKDIVRLSIK